MNITEKKTYIGILVCVLIAGIGITFAYFISGLTIGGSGGNASGTTAGLINVTYNAGTNALSLENAYPGQSESKQFSVAVTPTIAQPKATYAIILKMTTNDFEYCKSGVNKPEYTFPATSNTIANNCEQNAEELSYTLTSSSGVNTSGNITLGQITSDDVKPIELYKAEDATTGDTYTLTITFTNLLTDQNHNINKTLSGTVEVIFAE